ncbi:tetratricopeptide repeat protein [Streptomyces catenulae]|uniref:Tetratricopeptide repeat protein n=1 Tax=Streptomyces catenulae TaxID=66875 RepID=A0ABV2YWP3_9ACTN|nr:tetratricopeptide repeat protein [Streptomyces catenulae]
MDDKNDARAEGQGRVYQASGDQHIVENHHYAAERSDTWQGLDSIRWPSMGRAPAVLRGRTELMERLRSAVAPGNGNQVLVLHGLGGCGKTAVAHSLFRHATEEASRIGLWVNASDTASLRAGMLAVAADRGANEGELTAARSGLRAAADLVWDRLDHSPEPWMLVLDNADAPSVLRNGGWLRTSPRGVLLVTTRQAARHWWPGAELLQVGVLPREAAAQVLCDLAPTAGTVEEAEAVAEHLGRLPLALTLAGGFLAHQIIDPWSMADYGRNLGGGQGLDPIELLDQGALSGEEEGSRHLVSSTWQFSLNALLRQGLPEAVTLLRVLACWSGDPLPLSLLSGLEVEEELPRHRVELALRGLLDHSLTEVVSGSERRLGTHRVLLNSVWRDIPASDRPRLLTAATEQLLKFLPDDPQRRSGDPRVSLVAPHVVALVRRAVAESALDRDAVERATEAALLLVIALHRAGEYAPALTVAEEILELVGPRLAPDRRVMLRLRARRVKALYRMGKFDEARAACRPLLDESVRADGPEGLETLNCRLLLALALWQLGEQQEAKKQFERVIRGYTEVMGASHPLALKARADLVSMTQNEADGRQLVEDCRRELEEGHPILLGAEFTHASTLREAGRFPEALDRAREVYAAHEWSMGALHSVTLSTRFLLSKALADAGHKAEALEHATGVAEGRLTTLGPEHPWTRSAQKFVSELT